MMTLKKIGLIIFWALGFVPQFAQTVEARKYYNNTFGLVNYATIYYNKVIASANRVEANQYIDSLAQLTNTQLKLITDQKVFDNNTAIRKYSMDYLKHLNKICKKEFPQFYMFAFNTSFTDKDRKTYDKLRDQIVEPTNRIYDDAKKEAELFRSKYVWYYPNEYNLEYEEKELFDSATAYNDYIVDRIDAIDEFWTLAIEEEDMFYALEWSKLLEKVADNAIRSLGKLRDFKTDYGFRTAGIEYARHMKSIAVNELPEFIRIIRANEMTVEGEARAETLIPMLDDKREELFNLVQKNQYQFADSSDITINGRKYTVNTQLVEKTSFSNVNEYSDYIMGIVKALDDAWTITIEEDDYNLSLQDNDSLYSLAKKSLSALEKIGAYNGYDEFRIAAMNYAKHYIRVTQNELREFITLILNDDVLTETEEKKAEVLIPLLDDVREDLYFYCERTQTTVTGREGVYIKPWYPSRLWPEAPDFNYTEKTSFTSAEAYNDYLVEIVFSVADAWWHALQMDLGKKALPWVDSLKIQSDKVLISLQKMGPYEGSDELRTAAIRYVQWVGDASKTEIKEYIEIKLKEKLSEAEQSRLDKITPIVEDNTYDIWDELRRKQIDFANKFGFRVKF